MGIGRFVFISLSNRIPMYLTTDFYGNSKASYVEWLPRNPDKCSYGLNIYIEISEKDFSSFRIDNTNFFFQYHTELRCSNESVW